MPKGIKKQPTKKRAYVKKAKLVPPAPPEKDKDRELELLALLCSVFDHWTKEQKERNLKYLCARYYDFM